jgi:trans-2,3-dihydro-3-hydroxyanthranilate isomerase
MAHEIRIVDVFTERPLAGNQLAVVLDGRGMSSELMQRLAREMNFSETTFILPPDDPKHAAKVRIFTPGHEMPFAGHPTIGTAWVLATEAMVPGGSLEFILEEKIGPIPVRGVNDEGRLTFWMTHPEVIFGATMERAAVAEAIGVDEPEFVPDVPCQLASTGAPFLFAALREPGAVDKATADPSRVTRLLEGTDAHGVFVFALAGENRLYSRMFGSSVPEDPATGGASGPLGAFAVKCRLVERAPRVALTSEQGTRMGRQSFIHIELEYRDASDTPSRIEVGGSVRPVLSGTLADFTA